MPLCHGRHLVVPLRGLQATAKLFGPFCLYPLLESTSGIFDHLFLLRMQLSNVAHRKTVTSVHGRHLVVPSRGLQATANLVGPFLCWSFASCSGRDALVVRLVTPAARHGPKGGACDVTGGKEHRRQDTLSALHCYNRTDGLVRVQHHAGARASPSSE